MIGKARGSWTRRGACASLALLAASLALALSCTHRREAPKLFGLGGGCFSSGGCTAVGPPPSSEVFTILLSEINPEHFLGFH